MRRLLAVLIALGTLAAVLAGGAAPASSSSTSIPFQARIGNIFGIVPTLSEESTAVSNSAPATGSLVDNGGPVMPTSNVYAIFWQPTGAPEQQRVGSGDQRHESRAQREHHRPVRHRLVGRQSQRQRVRRGERRHVRLGSGTSTARAGPSTTRRSTATTT